MDLYKKTKISYDRASRWHTLKAPEVAYDGETIDCSGECSLHLKGRTESTGYPIYSSENAPGIIIGTGNIGSYLKNDEKDLNTYLSRDGGHTWFEIRKGSYLYEIGDHGGIIIAAKSNYLFFFLVFVFPK
jgi:hypothetical protein